MIRKLFLFLSEVIVKTQGWGGRSEKVKVHII